jgi:hypothetical protein
MRVQKVLREEVLGVLQNLNGRLKWENVVEMLDLLMERDCENIRGNWDKVLRRMQWVQRAWRIFMITRCLGKVAGEER